jgi:acyl-CoA dehydrogenase
VLAASAERVAELEAAWASVPDEECERWQRDRAILRVAGKARGERLARAWEALAG